MQTKSKVKVVEVKYPPAIGKVQMMSGIRTKEAAERWAISNGYPTVYFLKSRERVYADKMSHVAARAKALEEQSDQLVQVSEAGAGLLEYALLLAFLVALFLCLGGRPW